MTDINLVPTLVDGEARIRDIDLGARLGFAQPRDIRKIIARHRGALSEMGLLTEAEEVTGKGQKVTVTFLNKKQAIFITAKSDTPKATEITIEIIAKFDAYERGEVPVQGPQLDLDLYHFMMLPLEERRERRMLVAETRSTIGNVTAHNLFQRSIFKTRELTGFPGAFQSLFESPPTAVISITVPVGGHAS